MATVKLENVKKIYKSENKEVTAVYPTTLEIADKDFVVLVGPSGCGKSTTLRMIAGLEEISEGKIYIDGKVVNDVMPKDRDIAMVFQNYALYPHMTVAENLSFGLKLRNFPKDEIERRVKEAAKILGIEEYLDRKPKALSGGQRQRVAVGRAIVRHPKVFLFDEPLSNLDAKLRVQMRAEIIKLHQQLQTTMIYVTHDQVEAMTMGDKIVVMKGGVVQQYDEPLAIYKNPINKFVAGFIGSPAMNFIDGKLDNDYVFTFSEKFSLSIPEKYRSYLKNYLGKSITLGIRPENIHCDLTSKTLTIKSEFDAFFEVKELMGNEIFSYFKIGNDNFVARFPSDFNHDIGKYIKVYFDLEKIYFFDIETEKSILFNK